MNTNQTIFSNRVPPVRYTSEGYKLDDIAPNWRKGTPVYIRAERVGRAESVAETATRLGVTRSAVHRAIDYKYLKPDEREAIAQDFLSHRLVKDISLDRGITVGTVMETVRIALVHARLEAAMRLPENA